jgi:esterase
MNTPEQYSRYVREKHQEKDALSPMKLHYKEYGSGTPLVILHGLLGSGENWRAIAKALSVSCRVITIDLPNHGQSPHFPDADLGATVRCVLETMSCAGIDRAYLLGHSMGGKIAMQLSSECPERLEGLIVADMLPSAIPPAHLRILRACEQLDLSAATCRRDLDEALALSIPQTGTRAFVLKNVRRNPENQFTWQVNLQNIIKNYQVASDALPLTTPYAGKTLFIGGASSPYNIAAQQSLIHRWFPNAQIEMIPKAGHLVHADQPGPFSTLVHEFMR